MPDGIRLPAAPTPPPVPVPGMGPQAPGPPQAPPPAAPPPSRPADGVDRLVSRDDPRRDPAEAPPRTGGLSRQEERQVRQAPLGATPVLPPPKGGTSVDMALLSGIPAQMVLAKASDAEVRAQLQKAVGGEAPAVDPTGLAQAPGGGLAGRAVAAFNWLAFGVMTGAMLRKANEDMLRQKAILQTLMNNIALLADKTQLANDRASIAIERAQSIAAVVETLPSQFDTQYRTDLTEPLTRTAAATQQDLRGGVIGPSEARDGSEAAEAHLGLAELYAQMTGQTQGRLHIDPAAEVTADGKAFKYLREAQAAAPEETRSQGGLLKNALPEGLPDELRNKYGDRPLRFLWLTPEERAALKPENRRAFTHMREVFDRETYAQPLRKALLREELGSMQDAAQTCRTAAADLRVQLAQPHPSLEVEKLTNQATALERHAAALEARAARYADHTAAIAELTQREAELTAAAKAAAGDPKRAADLRHEAKRAGQKRLNLVAFNPMGVENQEQTFRMEGTADRDRYEDLRRQRANLQSKFDEQVKAYENQLSIHQVGAVGAVDLSGQSASHARLRQMMRNTGLHIEELDTQLKAYSDSRPNNPFREDLVKPGQKPHVVVRHTADRYDWTHSSALFAAWGRIAAHPQMAQRPLGRTTAEVARATFAQKAPANLLAAAKLSERFAEAQRAADPKVLEDLKTQLRAAQANLRQHTGRRPQGPLEELLDEAGAAYMARHAKHLQGAHGARLHAQLAGNGRAADDPHKVQGIAEEHGLPPECQADILRSPTQLDEEGAFWRSLHAEGEGGGRLKALAGNLKSLGRTLQPPKRRTPSRLVEGPRVQAPAGPPSQGIYDPAAARIHDPMAREQHEMAVLKGRTRGGAAVASAYSDRLVQQAYPALGQLRDTGILSTPANDIVQAAEGNLQFDTDNTSATANRVLGDVVDRVDEVRTAAGRLIEALNLALKPLPWK